MTSERHGIPVVAHVLVRSDDALALLRRAGTGLGDGRWAPPGGHLEPGETPRVAAARECAEELGLALEPDALMPVAALFFSGEDGLVGLNVVFEAELLERPELIPARDAADAAAWFPRRELPDTCVAWLPAALDRPVASDVGWYVER